MRATASVTAFREQIGRFLFTKRGNIKFRERMGAFLLMRRENGRVGGGHRVNVTYGSGFLRLREIRKHLDTGKSILAGECVSLRE